jgi:hypothetical protein
MYRQFVATPVKLLARDRNKSQYDYTFRLNPRQIRSSLVANYPVVGLAGWDGAQGSVGVNFQWVSNQPRTEDFEFMLKAGLEYGMNIPGVAGHGDVESDIEALERLMAKDSGTGEPPDMVYVYGGKSTHVRVASLSWNTIMWTMDGRRNMVQGQMRLLVMEAPRRRTSGQKFKTVSTYKVD